MQIFAYCKDINEQIIQLVTERRDVHVIWSPCQETGAVHLVQEQAVAQRLHVFSRGRGTILLVLYRAYDGLGECLVEVVL